MSSGAIYGYPRPRGQKRQSRSRRSAPQTKIVVEAMGTAVMTIFPRKTRSPTSLLGKELKAMAWVFASVDHPCKETWQALDLLHVGVGAGSSSMDNSLLVDKRSAARCCRVQRSSERSWRGELCCMRSKPEQMLVAMSDSSTLERNKRVEEKGESPQLWER